MRETKMKSTLRIMTSSKFTLIASAMASFWLLGFGLHAATPSNFDVAAAKEILGPDSEDIVASEDAVQDKNRAAEFAAKAKEKMSVQTDKKHPNHAIVLVGNDEFLLPIPLVKQKGKWFFDTKVGREEILNRRVGANELNAIEICRRFDDAQHEYAAEKHDGSKVNQYAQR